MENKFLAAALAVIVLAGCAGQPAARQSLSRIERLTPDPDLTPEEVVAIQLRALQLNDQQDRGIAVAFRFASPQNRASTGPLPRFAGMIRNGPYSSMLNHVSAACQDPLVRGNEAMQRVAVTASDGLVINYVFILSRQSSEPYQDCWMTDAVVIESVRRSRPSASV